MFLFWEEETKLRDERSSWVDMDVGLPRGRLAIHALPFALFYYYFWTDAEQTKFLKTTHDQNSLVSKYNHDK